ncbi:hypothetical protein QTP88_007295 [Uroleucon formosanum]
MNEALELEEIINQATVNDEPDEPSDDEEEYIPPLPSIASTVQSISTLRQALTATDGSENMLLYLEKKRERKRELITRVLEHEISISFFMTG